MEYIRVHIWDVGKLPNEQWQGIVSKRALFDAFANTVFALPATKLKQSPFKAFGMY